MKVMLLVLLVSMIPAFSSDYGATDNGDGTITLYHVDNGWSAGFSYLCKNAFCAPAQRANGMFTTVLDGAAGETFSYEFKVQDNATGQYILGPINVTVEGGEPVEKYGVTVEGSTAEVFSGETSSTEDCNGGIITYTVNLPEQEPVTKSIACGDAGQFTDTRDAQVYDWVRINGIVIMADNLNFVPPVQDEEHSSCYEGEEENCATYGRLYSWQMARQVCPDGWRTSTNQDWIDFTAEIEFPKPQQLTGPLFPPSSQFGEPANPFGFTAQPSGRYRQGIYEWLDQSAFYWMGDATESGIQFNLGLLRMIDFSSTELSLYEFDGDVRAAVRCVLEE